MLHYILIIKNLKTPSCSYTHLHNMPKRRQPVPTWRTPDMFMPFGIVITYGILDNNVALSMIQALGQ